MLKAYKQNKLISLSLGFACLSLSTSGFGFESTKVLPKGIRNISIRTIYTEASTQTDENGNLEPLAEPLWRPLRFSNVLKGETGLKRQQLEGLMLQQGFTESDSVGNFYAQLNAQINVWAPIVAYGLSDKITLGFAAPVYNSSTAIQAGFRSNTNADTLIASLNDPLTNNTESARELADKLQNAIGGLNDKLEDNGFSRLSKWSDTGLGDITVLAKMLVVDSDIFKFANTVGFVAPTGRVDDQNIMTDIAFGDGQWDIFNQVTMDQVVSSGIFFNQWAKYTYQAPASLDLRQKTYEETIDIETKSTRFKLGDKVEAGSSVQFEQESTGLTAGLGLSYFRKFSDRYDVEAPLVKKELQRDSAEDALYWQARLGYTTLPAFRRNEFAVPLTASIEYRKQYQSRNQPTTDFTQIDIGIFF